MNLLSQLADVITRIGTDIKALTERVDNAVQEGDPRLSDSRTPTAHDHPGKADLGPDGKVLAGQLPTPSGGGGGGAGIDDTIVGPDTTWSSEKITTDRAPAQWEMPGYGPGAPPTGFFLPTIEVVSMCWQMITGISQTMYNFIQFDDQTGASDGSGAGSIPIVNPGDDGLQYGRVHAVRNPATGQLTWWLPAAPPE